MKANVNKAKRKGLKSPSVSRPVKRSAVDPLGSKEIARPNQGSNRPALTGEQARWGMC